MKIPNRFKILNADNDLEIRATSLRKARKIARKVSNLYDTEARVVDSMTGVVQYIYRLYIDKQVLKV